MYREHADHLLQTGNAYRCFCSAEDLNTRAQYRASLGLPPDYDRTCAHMPKEESDDRAEKGDAHVIRLLVPDKYPDFNDIVYGRVRHRAEIKSKSADASFDDPILLKSDGFPTYHLANVVDDHLMKITHVIRGSVRSARSCKISTNQSARNGCLQHLSILQCTKHLAGHHLSLPTLDYS